MILILFILLASCDVAWGREVAAGSEPGNLDFYDEEYKEFLGDRNGRSRGAIKINGREGLYSIDRDSIYFTIRPVGAESLIDCAYIDSRNSYNGAAVWAGTCNLNQKIQADSDIEFYSYANNLIEKKYSFETRGIFASNKAESYPIGEFGDSVIYNKYTPKSILDARPETYIFSGEGCYSFKNKKVFLVFGGRSNLNILYLDVVLSEDPMTFRRISEKEIGGLSFTSCE